MKGRYQIYRGMISQHFPSKKNQHFKKSYLPHHPSQRFLCGE